MAVTVTRAPKRRTPPPREPRVRKAGFKPVMKRLAAKAGTLRRETFLGQFYRCLAFLWLFGMLTFGGVWLERFVAHKGAVAVAAWEDCANPPPLSHISACGNFKCLATINDENAAYVRRCHPEAMRS